jgi:two-component system chemotaxis response regulator CheY
MIIDRSIPILVVDDSATIIHIIRSLLRRIGFIDVDGADDGASALAKMRDKHYGLVISDWNMASNSGHNFLREVRGDPNLKQTPFIIVTGEYKAENVIAAKRAGVSNYIVKPFDAPTLKAKIESTFAVRGASSA